MSGQFGLRMGAKQRAIAGQSGAMMRMGCGGRIHGRGLQLVVVRMLMLLLLLLLMLRMMMLGMRILLGRPLLMERKTIVAHHLRGNVSDTNPTRRQLRGYFPEYRMSVVVLIC